MEPLGQWPGLSCAQPLGPGQGRRRAPVEGLDLRGDAGVDVIGGDDEVHEPTGQRLWGREHLSGAQQPVRHVRHMRGRTTAEMTAGAIVSRARGRAR